ncbi:MAG TPA: AarF/ABC1/UbiB kinase family protein [Myxococcota bacterium]|nr:AarF/ABC1/UbiB kinase family protein [Myxococcota bacterium]
MTAPTSDPRVQEILRPMPRRERLRGRAYIRSRFSVRRLVEPRVALRAVIARSLRWTWEALRFGAFMLRERWAGRDDAERAGVALRSAFERLGGTAIKLGQQLSVRVDVFPIEVCDALGALRDRVPPIPEAKAREAIEASLGAPIASRYAHVDWEPIGSASIACVYRATLTDGTEVAVKVRRPDVAYAFAVDITCVEIVTRAMEIFGFVRGDFFANMRRDVRSMFMEEMDFVREGRYQRLFRKMARHLDDVTAPRCFPELSSDTVLVSELVRGVGMDALLRAVESDDRAALASFAAQGIRPTDAAIRLMNLAFWGRFECPFLHSDPHPGNIILQPGGSMVMLDFGSCCFRPPRIASLDEAFVAAYVDDDLSTATEVSMALVQPVPAFDLNAMRRRMRRAFWRARLTDRAKDARWWERTTASVHLAVIEATQEFNVPIPSFMLQLLRSSLLYDTLACRLDGDINVRRMFKDWARGALERRHRAARDRLLADADDGLLALGLDELVQTTATVRRVGQVFQVLSYKPRGTFSMVTAKAAFAFLALLRGGVALALAGAVAFIYLWARGNAYDPTGAVLSSAVVRHPIFLGSAAAVGAITVRRIAMRLADREVP